VTVLDEITVTIRIAVSVDLGDKDYLNPDKYLKDFQNLTIDKL
jgi:hypothetical protein